MTTSPVEPVASIAPAPISPLAAGLAALRRFWRPFLLIQLGAVALALAFRFSPAFRAACETAAGWKSSGGLPFARPSCAVAGGLLPELAKLIALGPRCAGRPRAARWCSTPPSSPATAS